MNAQILELLDKFRLYYEIQNDKWRAGSFASARRSIDNYLISHPNFKIDINNFKTLQKLPNVGKGTLERIEYFLKGNIKKILPSDFYNILDVWEQLRHIRDIGVKKARELISVYKIYSIDELKDKVANGKIILTNNQEIGLKYYDDLIHKIPYSEMKKIDVLFQSIGSSIDKKMKIIIAGSYRRKRPASSDIDVIIAHPNVNTTDDFNKFDNYLQLFINVLKNKKIIVEELKMGSLTQKKIPKSYNVEILVKPSFSAYVRKVDVKYYPLDDLIPALLYFTGGKEFNIRMRKIAMRKGYLLNQYGLFKIGSRGEMNKIIIHSENDIFKIIGIPYIPPEKRNI